MVIKTKQWCVYIVKCSDNTLYTGVSNDLDARIITHNSGKGAKYTKNRRPVEVVWSELAENRSLAQKREYEIKKLKREDKLKLIEENAL